ncbi:MAG TPA: LacI family DNA-binding transcriptional regulator [bacterium]|nr:LacI family DNA-binding transcriptional regulator [bacterium]
MSMNPSAMKSRTNVTIKDIARKLQLHHTTVSRALRDHPDVKEETRRLILATAQEMNYHPNTFAANLRNQKSNVIGVIVPELSHDFFSSIVSEVTNEADRHGYSVMICQSNESVDQENKNISALIRNRVAGVLASTSQFTINETPFRSIMDAGIPLVFFDRVCRGLATSKVVVDFYQGACQMMEHLIELGFRRIAHIAGPADVAGARERLQGYLDVCRRFGLPLDERLIVPGGFLAENGVLAAERLLALAHRPDAVFAVNDEVAIGAMIRLKEEGLQVPQDIAVAGFDNDKISAFTTPPLTTVDVPRVEIGKKSVELLLPYLEPAKTTPEPVIVRLATKLVVRASTGHPSA